MLASTVQNGNVRLRTGNTPPVGNLKPGRKKYNIFRTEEESTPHVADHTSAVKSKQYLCFVTCETCLL